MLKNIYTFLSVLLIVSGASSCLYAQNEGTILEQLQSLAERNQWVEVLNRIKNIDASIIDERTFFELKLLEGKATLASNHPSEAIQLFKKSVLLAKKHCDKPCALLARSWHNLANAYLSLAYYSEAKNALFNSLKNSSTIADTTLAKIENSLGLYYQQQEQLDSSRYYFRLAIQRWALFSKTASQSKYYPLINLVTVLPSDTEKEQLLYQILDSLGGKESHQYQFLAATHLHLGELLLNKGQINKALKHLELAKTNVLALSSPPWRILSKIYLLLGQFWQQQGRPEESYRYLQLGQETLPRNHSDEKMQLKLLLSLARHHISQGQFEAAQLILEKTLNITLNSTTITNNLRARIDLLSAKLYMEQQEWGGAQYYLTQAGQFLHQLADDQLKLNIILTKCELYRETNKAKDAYSLLQLYEKKLTVSPLWINKISLETALVLEQLEQDQAAIDTLIQAIPKINIQTNEGPWLKLRLYTTIAHLFLKDTNKDEQKAFNWSMEGLQLLDTLLLHHEQINNTYQARYRFDALFASAMQAALYLGQENSTYWAKAFFVLEKSKTLTVLHKSKSSLFFNKTDWDKAAPLLIQQLQQELSEEQTILSYFWHKEASFVFVLKRDTLLMLPLSVSKKTNEDIAHFYQLVSTSPWAWDTLMDQQMQICKELGHHLYQSLWSPVVAHLSPEVVVIPDGVLHFLPFGALSEDLSSNRFVVEDYQLSFHFSPASWLRDQGAYLPPSGKDQLLAMAPDFDKDSRGLEPLFNSQLELENLRKRFNGQFLSGKKCTETNFMDKYTSAQVLHFATHGYYDNTMPGKSYLAFSEQVDSTENEYLYAYEIEQLEGPFSLVVMSACETALGTLYRGEGLLSLARSFYSVGAKNIVATQWQVDDFTSAQIMNTFYEHLQGGVSTDQALQYAQLNYLEEVEGDNRHPYFWAAYLHFGAGTTINLPKGHSFFYYVKISIPLFLIGFLVFYSFKKKQKKSILK